jgi:hypothetical protein
MPFCHVIWHTYDNDMPTVARVRAPVVTGVRRGGEGGVNVPTPNRAPFAWNDNSTHDPLSTTGTEVNTSLLIGSAYGFWGVPVLGPTGQPVIHEFFLNLAL